MATILQEEYLLHISDAWVELIDEMDKLVKKEKTNVILAQTY